MSATANLTITKISASQAQKEVTANDAFDILDKAIAGTLAKSITSSDVTLSADEARNAIISLSGTLTGNRNLIVPAVSKIYLIKNATSGAFTITVKTPSGTGVVVAQGTQAFVYCDGTNVIAGQTQTNTVYDVSFMKNSAPTANEILLRFPCVRSFSLPASLTGSAGTAGTTATGSTTLTCNKNGSSFGTIVFGAGASTPTFTAASLTNFVAGDVITIVAPGTPDATLANIAVTLLGALA